MEKGKSGSSALENTETKQIALTITLLCLTCPAVEGILQTLIEQDIAAIAARVLNEYGVEAIYSSARLTEIPFNTSVDTLQKK